HAYPRPRGLGAGERLRRLLEHEPEIRPPGTGDGWRTVLGPSVPGPAQRSRAGHLPDSGDVPGGVGPRHGPGVVHPGLLHPRQGTPTRLDRGRGPWGGRQRPASGELQPRPRRLAGPWTVQGVAAWWCAAVAVPERDG